MKRESNLDSTERLISIYDKLIKLEMNAHELSKEYGVSKRTIYRDIKKMKCAGVNIFKYRNGYRII